MTPAMAAGVMDRLWEMKEIVDLINAAAPTPGPRGPYNDETEGLTLPYYNLLVVDDHSMLATVAPDRESAIADFGKQLNKRLSLEPNDDSPALYLMDEWSKGPHWVNPTIPVFEISN